MALDKSQQQILKRLVREDSWDVLLSALKYHIDEINSKEITGNNEFETLRELHMNRGKVEGLKEFFEKIERLDV